MAFLLAVAALFSKSGAGAQRRISDMGPVSAMRRGVFSMVLVVFQAPARLGGALVFILHRSADGAWFTSIGARLAPKSTNARPKSERSLHDGKNFRPHPVDHRRQ
ncbi:hypothetical protein [Rhodoblastus sp.]|uniref:hypothetical protein n=1 Tax=Rhodoblastus sp. TaxID=1962975 RepID=UPI003F96E90A